MKKFLCLFFTLSILSLQGSNIEWSSSPTAISGNNYNAASSVLAIDANGNAIAAWVENSYVKASFHPVNGNWDAEVTVSDSGASSPRLVSDANGNATLIWIGNGVIYASTKSLQGGWSSALALSNTGANFPTLEVDSDGVVAAAWVRNGNIESSIKLFGSNWQGRATIKSNAPRAPSIAIGGSGNNKMAVLAWQGTSNGINVIYTSTKLLSSIWSSATLLTDSSHHATNPKVAVDSNGNAIAVWYEYDHTGVSYTNVRVKTSSLSPLKGMWSANHTLSSPGIRNPSDLSANIEFDSFGNAIAFWNISYDDETFDIESAIKPVNGQWSPSKNIVSSNLFAYIGSISTTKFGDTLGVYMYYNGANLLIQSTESNINGYLNNVWSVPLTLSLGTDNAFPKIAATIKGNKIYAAAIWENYSGTVDTILGVTGSKTLILPPSNLTVTESVNNLGAFVEYSNNLSWIESVGPNVVGYLIFRNGLFIKQVEAGISNFVDYNRSHNGAVTYSVAAIDNAQTQSAAVSISFP